MREGWELVRADEYPDTQYPEMTKANTQELSEWEAYCWLGYQKRLRFKSMLIIKSKTMRKEEAVENNLMKEQHPGMKFQKESNTRVTFGGTKK